MDQICAAFQISRQAHYQKMKREIETQTKHEQVLEMVRDVRIKHPRMGTRKVLGKIEPDLAQKGLKIGRDELFSVLRTQKMLVHPRKSRKRTTIPGLYRTPNLLAGTTIYRPNQVWVGDITYIDTEEEKFVFLFLLMDLYSRYIIGWDVSTSLAVEGAIQCLQMALSFRGKPEQPLIHHSDHGSQYSSNPYMSVLLIHSIQPSMGRIGNCYDNIYAERIIGTLKNEYLLGDRFVNERQVMRAAKQSIALYNVDRPHLSLNNVSPAEVYFNSYVQLPPLLIPEEVS